MQRIDIIRKYRTMLLAELHRLTAELLAMEGQGRTDEILEIEATLQRMLIALA
jgi:hypothetical protein